MDMKVRGIPDDFIWADTEPMVIEFPDNDKWIHPYIREWYSPGPLNEEHDDDMYHATFRNKHGEYMEVYFKSRYCDKKCEEYYADENWEDRGKQDLFKPPFIDLELLYANLWLTLTEDSYGPTPPTGGQPGRDTPEYHKWIASAETGQFYWSEGGEKVNAFLDEDAEISSFTPDCGLTTDGTDWWCDS